jgi:predicted amidohydrolase
LPAAGNATPATYEINGRQFVVIAAGGGKSGAPSGGKYVAFALPGGDGHASSRWIHRIRRRGQVTMGSNQRKSDLATVFIFPSETGMRYLILCGLMGLMALAQAARSEMPRTVRVGAIQMRIADSDREDNLRRAVEWIRKGVRESGIQFAVLPETFDIGWINPRAKELAEPLPGPTSLRLAELARELKIYIVGTLTECDGDVVYDTAFLIGPGGELLARHRKINILKWNKPQFSGNVYYRAGRPEDIGVVETSFGKVGIHICADIFVTNPDLTIKLRDLGARIVISPGGWVANPGYTVETNGESWRERISRKARESGVYFIGANCVNTVVAGPDWHGLPYVGQSVIAAPDGTLLKVGSKEREEIVSAELIL